MLVSGIGAALPQCRTDAGIAVGQRVRLRAVADAQSVAIAGRGREFGIETHIRTHRPIEELKVGDPSGSWKYILDEEQFTAGGGADDQIGHKTPVANLLARANHILSAVYGRLETAQIVMDLRFIPRPDRTPKHWE